MKIFILIMIFCTIVGTNAPVSGRGTGSSTSGGGGGAAATCQSLALIQKVLEKMDNKTSSCSCNSGEMASLKEDLRNTKSEMTALKERMEREIREIRENANSTERELAGAKDEIDQLRDQQFGQGKLTLGNYSRVYELTRLYPKDCADALAKGFTKSGIYTIQPDYLEPFQVYCDMDTDRGGWTVFQRRKDGSVDFERNWVDYVEGFGSLHGEFWLGLYKMYRLTRWKKFAPELRVELLDHENNTAYAHYAIFSINSSDVNYSIRVGNYSGSAGDSFSSHSGKIFTTPNRPTVTATTTTYNRHYGRYQYSTNTYTCAKNYYSGWWFQTSSDCYSANLNGIYYHNNVPQVNQGLRWNTWKSDNYYSLKGTEMKTRPNRRE